MKKKFHHFYTPSEGAFDTLWNDANIAVDTNVLLNLYTYSKLTATAFLDVLEKYADRLWMPNMVGLEYHTRRCSTISKEAKRYLGLKKDIDKVIDALKGRKQQPHIEGRLVQRFQSVASEVMEKLEVGKNAHSSLMSDDFICDKITKLFDGRVGEEYSEETLNEIYQEGKERYENKTPPGFCDSDKPEPDRYADLVIWKQLITHAKTTEKPILFVTDDLKEDWWNFTGNSRTGPHSELRNEFIVESGQEMYLYTSDAFISIAKERGADVSEPAAKEIKAASEDRLEQANSHQMVDPFINSIIRDASVAAKAREAYIREKMEAQQLREQRDIYKDLQDKLNSIKTLKQLEDSLLQRTTLPSEYLPREYFASHPSLMNELLKKYSTLTSSEPSESIEAPEGKPDQTGNDD